VLAIGPCILADSPVTGSFLISLGTDSASWICHAWLLYTTSIPVSWACFTFVSLHFIFDSMKSGGVLVKHVSWWPDAHQSMPLPLSPHSRAGCLVTGRSAIGSPEERRRDISRSRGRTSWASLLLPLRMMLDFIVVVLLSLPHYKGGIFCPLALRRNSVLCAFCLSFLCSACRACVVVLSSQPLTTTNLDWYFIYCTI